MVFSGELDRAALGAIVFRDPAARQRLNQATHLPIFFQIFCDLAWHWLCGRLVVVLDMPLLFETKTNKLGRCGLFCAGGLPHRLFLVSQVDQAQRASAHRLRNTGTEGGLSEMACYISMCTVQGIYQTNCHQLICVN
jgi:hypothetical protein